MASIIPIAAMEALTGQDQIPAAIMCHRITIRTVPIPLVTIRRTLTILSMTITAAEAIIIRIMDYMEVEHLDIEKIRCQSQKI